MHRGTENDCKNCLLEQIQDLNFRFLFHSKGHLSLENKKEFKVVDYNIGLNAFEGYLVDNMASSWECERNLELKYLMEFIVYNIKLTAQPVASKGAHSNCQNVKM